MKHRIALMLALAAVAVAAVTTPVAGAGVRTAKVQKVTVRMFDFRFKLSSNKLKAGRTTFMLINSGHSIHNFSIPGVHTSPFLPPGGKKSFTVNLKKGNYRYVCTVPRHAELGMFGKLAVT